MSWFRRPFIIAIAFYLLLGGCGGDAAPLPDAANGAEAGATGATRPSDLPEQIFDREFIFLAPPADSSIGLPWLFRTRVTESGVVRETTSRIVRAGTWELLADEWSDTPAIRTSSRILPSEKVRLIAGGDNQIESIFFRDPPREVQTELREILAEWPRPGGESIFLYSGRIILPSVTADGVVLDLARQWGRPGGVIGDWIFLSGQDGVQIFLEEVLPIQEERANTRYRGWIRIDPAAGPWATVMMRWEDMRPFERARRDIPARWSFSTPGGDLEGTLNSTSSQLTALEGEGPILPLMGLFQVEGTVRVLEREIPVKGLVRHQQY